MDNVKSQNIVLNEREFKMVEWLGSGNFGTVVKVKRSGSRFVAKKLFHKIHDKTAFLKE